MVIFTLPSLPVLHAQNTWIINHLICDQYQNANKLEISQCFSLFHAIHQDRISDKVNTVAERILLVFCVLKQEITNQKIISLQTLVDRIGHNDRLRDFHHTSSVAVTEFILLISEHNRIVSDIKQSPCWASMIEETTNIVALRCPFP